VFWLANLSLFGVAFYVRLSTTGRLADKKRKGSVGSDDTGRMIKILSTLKEKHTGNDCQ